jgi:hypothetical protein
MACLHCRALLLGEVWWGAVERVAKATMDNYKEKLTFLEQGPHAVVMGVGRQWWSHIPLMVATLAASMLCGRTPEMLSCVMDGALEGQLCNFKPSPQLVGLHNR